MPVQLLPTLIPSKVETRISHSRRIDGDCKGDFLIDSSFFLPEDFFALISSFFFRRIDGACKGVSSSFSISSSDAGRVLFVSPPLEELSVFFRL
ncbi:hypothetical protein ACJIZ3_007026 [Penstemon smallii]|uniref:Uncharacterized protein n=1 Tax=Penstemon smallii TaxID=265156 RepID=A0ABD3S9C6_9LAMI